MEQLYAIGLFLFVLFLLLGSGVWIGLALLGTAYIGMEIFAARPTGDAMMTAIWHSPDPSANSNVSALICAQGVAVGAVPAPDDSRSGGPRRQAAGATAPPEAARALNLHLDPVRLVASPPVPGAAARGLA